MSDTVTLYRGVTPVRMVCDSAPILAVIIHRERGPVSWCRVAVLEHQGPRLIAAVERVRHAAGVQRALLPGRASRRAGAVSPEHGRRARVAVVVQRHGSDHGVQSTPGSSRSGAASAEASRASGARWDRRGILARFPGSRRRRSCDARYYGDRQKARGEPFLDEALHDATPVTETALERIWDGRTRPGSATDPRSGSGRSPSSPGNLTGSGSNGVRTAATR